MPTENAQRVREAYEALSRDDLDGMLELLHPEMEFRNPDYAMEPGTRHGRDGFRRAWEAGQEVLEDLHFDVERIVEGDDVIVVVVRISGRGRGGGVPIDSRFGHVLELRGDQVARVSWFQDPAEAFAAAGISAP